MENILEIESFDTSLLAEPMLGEDNEVIGYFTSEDADEYFSDSDNEPDDSWFDNDTLESVGWGDDEAYGW
jgi:hypothetical protein